MVILVPLSFLRRLDSLRHTSYVALFSCGEYLLAHKMTSRAESLACSIPRLDCDRVPLLSLERDETTRRNTSHQDHTQLCFNVPYPSFCFHLCPERNVPSPHLVRNTRIDVKGERVTAISHFQ